MPDAKLDFKRDLTYTARPEKFDLLEIPPRQYLQASGRGDPNTSPDFAQAIERLYPVAYGLKFLSKNEMGRDYVVPPLEGLWRAPDMEAFRRREKSAWEWTLLLMVPDWIGEAHYSQVAERSEAKTGRPIREDVRFATLAEGLVVQTLHIGSFDEEGPVLEEMHERFIPSSGLKMTGDHHEIYLSDFRRVPADRRKTILRQPVTRLFDTALSAK